MMPTKFQQLSSYERFGVFRLLAKGETANDPELAGVMLETADHFRSQSRVKTGVFRWTPIVLALLLAVGALSAVVDGQVGMAFFLLFIAICAVANIMLNPWTRPRNVARSAEASRRVLASIHQD
jgi:hypothetical protein